MRDHETTPTSREFTNTAQPTISIDGDPRAGLVLNRASLLAAMPEESLVVDDRSGLTPAQAVEGKLLNLLRNESLSVSHLQLRGMVRGRCES
ncbi:MAG TPA: hypothetical protein VKP69_30630 [Isosphaeraceae bacterium]|jgi:hypothetical protein|nr:hypothetical protein [Isosphaeraceae bacterium]